MTPRPLLISVLTTSLILSTTAHADWRSLLDDLTETTKTISTAVSEKSENSSSLDYNTIVSGLKEALTIGAKDAIANVSENNGYLSNDLIKIPMPPQLKQVSGLMRSVGLTSMADEFEQSMNHAAEKAAPEATKIIINAIKDMTIEDANAILQGSDTAATDFFKKNTSNELTSLFKPVISQSLNEVGTTRYYNELADKVADVPFVGETINVNLPDYVTTQALNGLFTMIAIEEKKIRENPAARTTSLLKSVFGSK